MKCGMLNLISLQPQSRRHGITMNVRERYEDFQEDRGNISGRHFSSSCFTATSSDREGQRLDCVPCFNKSLYQSMVLSK